MRYRVRDAYNELVVATAAQMIVALVILVHIVLAQRRVYGGSWLPQEPRRSGSE